MRSRILKRPVPYLRIDAQFNEWRYLWPRPEGIDYFPPGMILKLEKHLDNLQRYERHFNNLPLHLRTVVPKTALPNIHKAHAVAERAVAADCIYLLWFASDMEKENWPRPAVEAHELNHLDFYSFTYANPEALAAIDWLTRDRNSPLFQYVRPYLKGMGNDAFLALTEFAADLAAIEAFLANGGELYMAVFCTHPWGVTELYRAWEAGMRGSTVIDLLKRTSRRMKG